MYCPSCGKAIADGSAFCMHCGKATGLAGTSVSSALVLSPDTPVCPKCGQIDAVRKVSSIVSAGTSRGTAPATWVGELGGHTVSGTTYKETFSSTDLAQRLSIPSEDQVKTYVEGSIPTLPPSPREMAWKAWVEAHPVLKIVRLWCRILLIISLVGIPILFLWVWLEYELIKSRLKEDLAAWETQKAQRDRFVQSKVSRIRAKFLTDLYYCFRDDVVFLTGTALSDRRACHP